MAQGCIIFFIGTTAEYIKVFPVMECLKKNNVAYKIVASGQNEISKTDIAKKTELKIDVQLSLEEKIIKNVFGLFSWWLLTLPKAVKQIKQLLIGYDAKKSVLVVHGDTISTTMGAIAAKIIGIKIAHIEAGLRSNRLFTPFPEELDRLLTSKLTDYHFAPGNKAFNALPNRCKKTNTKFNTLVDALIFSKGVDCEDEFLNRLYKENYGVFVCHRQENLMNKLLVNTVVETIEKVSIQKKAVFILHKITENTLKSLNLYERLKANKNIILLERVEYFNFMKLLAHADFVVTDGGSNQEELSYLGKPTLIIRDVTEREEGLGYNAIMYEGNIENIIAFVNEYDKYVRDEAKPQQSPSEIISDELIRITL